MDAVTQAAVAHAQFETIHPFADGNGRIGVLAEVDQVPTGRGRPRRWWVTPELLELVGR